MPPRLPLRPLLRSLQSPGCQARAPISSTSKNGALQDLGAGGQSASKALLDFDDKSSEAPAANSASSSGTSSLNDPIASSQSGQALYGILKRSNGFENISHNKETFDEKTKLAKERTDLSRQMTRNWKAGDVYAPHDISDVEMLKWRQPKRPSKDILDILGLNPLDHYKNFAMMSEFMTEMGRIKHSNETGLRSVNQRKMAKAIRRAIGMGLHPSTHRHPEILFGLARTGPRYQNSRNPEPTPDKVKVK